MKVALKSILIAALLCMLTSTPAAAENVVIAVSSAQAPDGAKADIEQAVALILDTVKPGETAYLFDGTSNRLIAEFRVPEGKAYQNPRAKLAANRTFMEEAKAVYESAHLTDDPHAKIDIPGLFRNVATNYPATDTSALIVFGSPLADFELEPSLSMRGGAVPNDGHITARLGQSPYGMTGVRGTLKGYNVYFWTKGGEWKQSTAHSSAVERAWTLSVSSLGGSMQYFGDDLKTLLSLARKGGTAHPASDQIVPTSKLEMIRFEPNTASAIDIFSADLAGNPASQRLTETARNVQVGISWNCSSCDLDLYLRPNAGAEVIYFGHTQTTEGRLFKDYLNSPSLTNGYETIALHGPLDLKRMRVAVNFYSGSVLPKTLSGEIRISVNDDVWAMPFTIDAATGNSGEGADRILDGAQSADGTWIVIDPMDVLKRR